MKLNYTICLSMHILFSGYCYVIIFYSSALLEHCAKDTYSSTRIVIYTALSKTFFI